jgi:hypothetical protein
VSIGTVRETLRNHRLLLLHRSQRSHNVANVNLERRPRADERPQWLPELYRDVRRRINDRRNHVIH